LIAVDTNLLVYAHRRDSPFYQRASDALRNLVEGARPWAVPWPCIHEFYAIVTHLRIYDPPSTPTQAWAQLRAWTGSPSLNLLGEDESYLDRLAAWTVDASITGPKVHDARVAAICAGAGVAELWTADRDFSRFPGLVTRNPLVG
jgi:uncharacterized protein